MNHQSNALWPAGAVPEIDNITIDRHATFDQAQSACIMLRRTGLNGERRVFPLAIWLSRAEDHPRVPDGMLLHLYRAMLDELDALYPRMSDDDPNAPLQRFRVLRAALRNRR